MDIRNVQKTGDMFYIYLPTKWCKKFGIGAKTKVAVSMGSDGSLNILPSLKERKQRDLKLSVKETSQSVLHKLIVACYINPADSFSINLEKGMDYTKILDQKKLLSLELVEVEGSKITCESSLSLSDPSSLLKTMLKKIKNLIIFISKNLSGELVEKYEEEIDRNKVLIDKSVVTSMITPTFTNLKTIELHYISMIAKELERLVDHMITLEKPKQKFLDQIHSSLAELQSLLDDRANLNYKSALDFLRKIDAFENIKVHNLESYRQRRMVRSLNNISEVVIDWAITNEIGK